MTRKLSSFVALAVLAGASLGMAFLGGGEYSMDWYTIDSGGGQSLGGGFEMSGTIGQWDASLWMSGGEFKLGGGFWPGGRPATRQVAALTDLAMLDGVVISGGITQMQTSDNQYFEAEARVTGEAHQTHLLRAVIAAESGHSNPQTMHLTLESRISDIEGLTTLFLRDWDTNQMTLIAEFVVGISESVREVAVPNADRFVRDSDGRIEMEFKQIVLIPFTLNGFHTLIDLLEMAVE